MDSVGVSASVRVHGIFTMPISLDYGDGQLSDRLIEMMSLATTPPLYHFSSPLSLCLLIRDCMLLYNCTRVFTAWQLPLPHPSKAPRLPFVSLRLVFL